MKLDFHWVNLLILFGAVQGLIFGILLLFNKKHPGAKFLSVFMFVLAYNGLETFNWSGGLMHYIVFFELFPFVIIFGLGPSLYLYVRSLLQPDTRIPPKIVLWHFSLVFAQFTLRLVVIAFYIMWNVQFVQTKVTPTQLEDIYFRYAEPLSVVVFSLYLALTFKEFRNNRYQLPTKLISKEGQSVVHQWIRALLYCMLAVAVLWPLTILAPYLLDINDDSHYYPIEIGLVFFIYWIAFVGYHKTKLIYLRAPKVSSNGISHADAASAMKQLKDAMELDKLYRDPELNLSKVATHTGLNPKQVSATLNQHFHRSFNDFINEYRISEVQEKLSARENEHLTIFGIALESGFNSQATFQRVFKNTTGMSPREYMNRQIKKAG
jgi:AraC-like DNA-binding protein